jgi:hypothetical protein
MMALGLREQRDPRHQSEGADEIVELELAGQVTRLVTLPARNRTTQSGDLRL